MHKPEKNGQEQNTITPDKSDQSSFFRIQFNKATPSCAHVR